MQALNGLNAGAGGRAPPFPAQLVRGLPVAGGAPGPKAGPGSPAAGAQQPSPNALSTAIKQRMANVRPAPAVAPPATAAPAQAAQFQQPAPINFGGRPMPDRSQEMAQLLATMARR
jgi:hypothetical protein